MNYNYKYVDDYVVLYTDKFETKIDKEDLNFVLTNIQRIYPKKPKNKTNPLPYVGCVANDDIHYNLPRLLLNASENEEVDHIYHDTLDNRKTKLRLVSQIENKNNKLIMNNSFPGLMPYGEGAWRARVRFNNKLTYLGIFEDIREAVCMIIIYKKWKMPQIYMHPERYGEKIIDKLRKCDFNNTSKDLIKPRLICANNQFWIRCPICEAVSEIGYSKQEAINNWNNKSHVDLIGLDKLK